MSGAEIPARDRSLIDAARRLPPLHPERHYFREYLEQLCALLSESGPARWRKTAREAVRRDKESRSYDARLALFRSLEASYAQLGLLEPLPKLPVPARRITNHLVDMDARWQRELSADLDRLRLERPEIPGSALENAAGLLGDPILAGLSTSQSPGETPAPSVLASELPRPMWEGVREAIQDATSEPPFYHRFPVYRVEDPFGEHRRVGPLACRACAGIPSGAPCSTECPRPEICFDANRVASLDRYLRDWRRLKAELASNFARSANSEEEVPRWDSVTTCIAESLYRCLQKEDLHSEYRPLREVAKKFAERAEEFGAPMDRKELLEAEATQILRDAQVVLTREKRLNRRYPGLNLRVFDVPLGDDDRGTPDELTKMIAVPVERILRDNEIRGWLTKDWDELIRKDDERDRERARKQLARSR